VLLEADSIPVGQSSTVRAAGLGRKGEAVSIATPVWSTTSGTVATVSSSGVVSAVAPGQTMVIASINGVQGQAPLTVVLVPIARVSISPVSVRMVQGKTMQLTATALSFSGHALPGRTVAWTSADASTATVTSAGLVTAVLPGVTTIVATGEGVSASAVVTITDVADAVARVSLSPTVGSLTVGGTAQLIATLTDIAGRTLIGRTVTWSVGDTLRVFVGVKAAEKPASVVATVGSLRTTLQFGYTTARGVVPLWVGLLDITDIPAGPHTLMVTATAPGGGRGVGSIRILRDFRKVKGGSGPPPKNK